MKTIKEIRIESKKSKKTISEEIGVTPLTISKIEKNKSINGMYAKTIIAYAKSIGITAERIMEIANRDGE